MTFIIENILSEGGITGTTISGTTYYGNGLTANTISATTYQNMPDNVSGKYLPLSGGTVTGNTIFTNGLTANTISADTLTVTNNISSTSRNLFASDLTPTVDWENGLLAGLGGSSSIDWGQRLMYDSGPNLKIDWQNSILYDGGIITSIDWDNRSLRDSFSGLSMNWDLRRIFDSSGLSSISYGDRRLIKSNSFTAFDWENGILTGQTNIQSSTISATTYQNLPDNVTGRYLPLSGGTVTGNTIFTNGLTSNTISATTYQNLPKDIFVTGGTYSNGTASFTNNSGGTFNVTGFSTGSTSTVSGEYLPLSGGTVTGNTIFTSGLTANTISGNTLTITDSIESALRYLKNSSSNVTVDWDNLILYGSTGNLYWDNGLLKDQGPNISVDWVNRLLTTSNEDTVLDWENKIMSGMTSISASTISGGTLYGDGSNLTGIGGGTFTGGTVTGPTIFTNGLSANTISATTYQNLTSGNLATVQASRTTGYNLTPTPAFITLDTTDVENQPTIIQHDNTNTERIYVYSTGLYLIHYHGDVGPGTVSDFEFAVTKNLLTLLVGSNISGKNSSTDKVTAGVNVMALLNSGDYISLVARYIGSSGGIANNVVLSITKMEGVVGPSGVSGATGPQGPAGTGLFTGGTITNPTFFTGGLSANTFSATTISGGTLYGDGSNLTGISGGSPGGTTREVQFNNGGSFSGAANVEIADGNLQLVSTSDPATPSAGNLLLYSKDIAGRLLPKWIGPSGIDTPIQPNIMFNNVSVIGPGGGTTVGVLGCTVTSVGTVSNPNITSTNLKTQTRRIVNTSAAGAGSLASTRIASLECWRGNAAGLGGFFVVGRFGLTTLQTGMRMFIGLTDTATAAPTNIDPTTSTTPGKIGMAINASTGNWNLVHNITGTLPTIIPLGGTFPVNNTNLYEMILFAKPNDTVVTYRITNLSSFSQVSGTLSTNLPASITPLGRLCWATNNATAGAVAWDLSRFSLESDY